MTHATRPGTTGRRKLLTLAVAGLTGSALLAATSAVAVTLPSSSSPDLSAQAVPAHGFTNGRYVVQLKAQPLAAYDGHVRGYVSTKPAHGKKVDARSVNAKRYTEYLKSKGAAVRAKHGAPAALNNYSVTFPGFSANLTANQAFAMTSDPDVVAVTKDKMYQVDATTRRTTDFLGLERKNGIWDKLGGTKRNGAGSGVIVGVIDTGIWPESKSFASLRATTTIPGWKGGCVAGEDNSFPTNLCNDKLIGAKYFVDGFGRANLSKTKEFLSPRDGAGHGSHTASTAAGDFGPSAIMPGGTNLGVVSGVAPAARVAMYKACWEGETTANCTGVDLTAAIDMAVADGVDVINYSIGGATEGSYFDPPEIAFMNAAQAGVFVAASAGNSGPGPSTLDHPSPWLTTVAASTYSINESTVVFGNGLRRVGVSTTAGLAASPLVDSVVVKKVDKADNDAKLCMTGSLDPVKVKGKVVLCDRGVNPRIDKSLEVQSAGGIGMVLLNPSQQGGNGDFHFVPTIHLEFIDAASYDAIHTFARTAGATAEFLAGVSTGSTTQVPEVASFSSRGPSMRAGGDVLKPDISAPGVDVLAAVAPASNHTRTYDFMSGTSMAAPHVAGIAALIKAEHPTWSPMAIKSALMTTAFDVRHESSPFNQGAGQVRPTTAFDPGLVYDSGVNDWRAFLKGQGCNGCPADPPAIAASDLNQASIAVGSLTGTRTVTRTVTNVSQHTETYTASVSGLAGFHATVTPSKITLRLGKSATFTVKFDRTDATLNTWSTGNLTWKSRAHTVRGPVALKPVALAVPASVVVNPFAASGSTPISIVPGADNVPITSAVRGLVGATPVKATVPVQGNHVFSLTAPVSTDKFTFRFETSGLADDDIDVNCGQAGSSGGGTASELVQVSGVPGGTLITCTVNGFSAGGGRTSSAFTATSWFVNETVPEGNATVPATTTGGAQGQPVSVVVSWTGLDTAKRYFGYVENTASGVTAKTAMSLG